MNIRIDGATLGSLRARYKASIEVAAKMANMEAEQFKQWENEGAEVSITEAKRIAKAFHSHWSVFLLRDKVKPITEPINHRAGYNSSSPFSSKTIHAYEVARKILDTSEEIEGQTIDSRLATLRHLGQAGEDAGFIARKTRELMGITSQDIIDVRGGPYLVYAFWKYAVGKMGVYISEQEMPIEETKAFLLTENGRAVIVVNKKDPYIFSRIFSLMHELGHLVKGEDSAACKVTISASRVSPEESWCNKFASELLAYDEDVMKEPLVEQLKRLSDPAPLIRRLSSKYKVSFTVMLYKLKRHNKITDRQCDEMLSFFENVILPNARPKTEANIRLGRSFYVGRDVSKASVGLTREVIEKQQKGDLTYSQAAKLLDTRTKYLEDIKTAVGFGS